MFFSQKSSASDPYKAFDKFFEWYQERGPQRGDKQDDENEKPFFAYIHVMDVHGPYRYLDANHDAIKNSKSLGPEHPVTPQELADRPKPIATFIPWANEERGKQRREWRAAYAAGVCLFDQKFGRVLKQLEEMGVMDDCIVVVTSDHGEQLLEDGGWGHGHNVQNYSDERTALDTFPRQDRHGGTKVDTLVRLVDLNPTLSDACYLKGVDDWEGRSLLPLAEGGTLPEESAVATSIMGDPNIFSIRSRDRLLIWDGHRDSHELYDVSQPSLAKKESCPAGAASCEPSLKRTESPCPTSQGAGASHEFAANARRYD